MKRHSVLTGFRRIANYIRTVEALGALAICAAAATVAHAQFRPIPNYVGIGAGAQFRNDVNNHLSGAASVAPRIVSLPFGQLPTEQEGQEYWCAYCKQTNPCLGGGQGALALGSQGQWSCTSGATLPNGFPLSIDVSASAHRIQGLAPNSATGDALSQGQSHLNDLTTATANYNMGANRLQNLNAGSVAGDAISYGQSGASLSGLNLNSNTLSSMAPATASGQAIAFAQGNAQLKTNNSAIAVVSSSEAGPSATPLMIAAPASIVTGRALVLVIGVNNAGPVFTLPSGFTQIRQDTGSIWSQVFACKTATGSEPGSYSTAFTGGGTVATGAVLQLSNTDCAHLDTNSGGFVNSALTYTIPSLTTAQTNEYLLAAGSSGCVDVPTIGTGQALINNANIGRLVVSGYLQAGGGASLSPVLGPLSAVDCGAVTVAGAQVAFIPNSAVQAVPLITNQTGAQLGTLNASVNNVLNVMAPPYNALGDGNTDDLAAIQQAVYDACGANPPTFPSIARKTVYLPKPSVCYMHSQPLRIPCTSLEVKGDTGTSLCQNYAGNAIIQGGWGSPGSLPYAAALVGSGNSLVSAAGQLVNSIDLARYLNGTGTNNLNTKFATGFNIAFFMKGTAGGGQILGSHPAYPGTGNGAFAFTYGSNQVTATVNTVTGGLIAVGTCAAQTLGTVYEIELDWDGSTYRLWQGTPSGTAVLCGSSTSSNRITQGVFEEMMLPDGGPHQFWPDGSSNQNNAFAGNLDSIHFDARSLHTTAYTAPNAKFTLDVNGSSILLENFDASLNGTQIAYSASGNIYSTNLGGYAISSASGANIHDLELCALGTGNGGKPDGIFAAGGDGSRWTNLSCSNASYVQMDFYNNDFYARVTHSGGFGGHLGFDFGAAWNQSVSEGAGIDGTDVACEVYQGGGGGSHEDYSARCVDRGSLRYGWIENQSSGNYYYPAMDQEVGSPNFIANVLLNAPGGAYTFVGGLLSPGNTGPYVIQDGGGAGATFTGTFFATFGAPPEIIDYTNGSPASPTLLVNTARPAGVALSNQAGNPNILTLGNGQSSMMQALELQQVPKFDVGLQHVIVNPIADPAAPTATVVGGTASTAYGPYFMVCHDINGGITNTSVASNTVANGPASLSVSNYINVAWSAVTGCATFDILKGSTSTALALGVTGTSYHDIGGSTSAYTAPIRNTTADVSGLMQISTGMPFAKIPGTVVNGGRFYCTDCDPPANPPVTCTHSGAKTGSWVDGLNSQWLCVP